MLETVSEYAVVYFKVGGIIGFGIGALAQVVKETGRNWRFGDCLILAAFWPFVVISMLKARR